MIEIVSVAWERIQLVVYARASAGSSLPTADDIRLARLDRSPAASMPPTEARVDDGTLVLRFNVMAGPGQMPLEPGRWGVAIGSGDSSVVPIANGVAIDLATASRSFPLAKSRYDVIASVEPDSRAMTFQVDRVVTARRSRGMSARARAALRPIVRSVRALPATTCIALARRTVRRSGRRRILFTSGSARELRGNLQAIHDRMVARGLDREYDLVRSSGARRRTREGEEGRLSLPELWRLTRTIASADVVLVTGSRHEWAHVIAPRPDARYIQLWHAPGAFKTMGYSRVGKKLALSPFSKLHKNYTHVVVSSEHVRPFYAEAFGVPVERVVATGIPRTDRFFDPEMRAAGRAAALEAFPMVEGKMTILFAPTFRGPSFGAFYDQDQIDIAAFHALAVEKDAVVIFKMHPFVRTPLAIPDAFRDRLIDATRTTLDVNELMFVVDLMITDYSSIIYEFATLGRPMLFFAYDLDDYIASRDFYEPFDTFVPGRIVRTFDDLLDAIRREDYELEKVAPFAARQFADTDGRSSDRVIDQLIIDR